MAFLRFNRRCVYNEFVYEADTTYAIKDYPNGYINRWLKREVAEEVEDGSDALPDPRNVEEPEEVFDEEDFTGLEVEDPDSDDTSEEEGEEEEEPDEET